MSSKNVPRRMSMIVLALCFLPAALGQVALQTQRLPLEQRLQIMEQASARSQQQLHSYQWIEATTLTIDGKAKEPKQSLCSYSADGHLIKKPMGGSGEPQISGSPLKKHIIKKKLEEFHEEMAQVGGLTALYLPLNNGRLKDALHSRTGRSIQALPRSTQLGKSFRSQQFPRTSQGRSNKADPGSAADGWATSIKDVALN